MRRARFPDVMNAVTSTVTNSGTSAAAHLGIDLAEYNTRIRTFIPGYDNLHDIVAAVLRALIARRAPVIVDLGIGSGALAARCLDACPSARVIGVDEDELMLRAARERLGDRLARAIHGSFESVALPRADAFVACLALHHIPTPARRLRLFRRLHRALRPGGVLISADCYPASNPRLDAADRASWLSFLEESYTPAIARRYLRTWAREDHYAPLTDEIDTLRRAGFRVEIPARRQAFAVIVATP
jgi:tRNA (cmo5U34)-methyltransferase